MWNMLKFLGVFIEGCVQGVKKLNVIGNVQAVVGGVNLNRLNMEV